MSHVDSALRLDERMLSLGGGGRGGGASRLLSLANVRTRLLPLLHVPNVVMASVLAYEGFVRDRLSAAAADADDEGDAGAADLDSDADGTSPLYPPVYYADVAVFAVGYFLLLLFVLAARHAVARTLRLYASSTDLNTAAGVDVLGATPAALRAAAAAAAADFPIPARPPPLQQLPSRRASDASLASLTPSSTATSPRFLPSVDAPPLPGLSSSVQSSSRTSAYPPRPAAGRRRLRLGSDASRGRRPSSSVRAIRAALAGSVAALTTLAVVAGAFLVFEVPYTVVLAVLGDQPAGYFINLVLGWCVERPLPLFSAPDEETDDIMLRAREIIKLILEDDPEFSRAAPPFVANLCDVETDSGAGTISNTTGLSHWLQKAVDFVASYDRQAAVKDAKSFVHDVASAGAQGDVLSEKLKSMLVCVDRIVEIVDDFVEVHSLVKITWTLATYGYKDKSEIQKLLMDTVEFMEFLDEIQTKT
ncbi:hypothetical protein HK405_013200, partial [Cladochytrium tenue]